MFYLLKSKVQVHRIDSKSMYKKWWIELFSWNTLVTWSLAVWLHGLKMNNFLQKYLDLF